MRFEADSLVTHFHQTQLRRYFKTQIRHGYFRVRSYFSHPARVGGAVYSGLLEYLQPPLAMLLVSIPCISFPGFPRIPVAILVLLLT